MILKTSQQYIKDSFVKPCDKIVIIMVGFDNSNMIINAQVKATFTDILIFYWKQQKIMIVIKQNI